MPKRKGRNRGWGALQWKTVEVGEGALGQVEDCFCFTIEEVDGEHYLMEKNEVGGYRVKARGEGTQSKKSKISHGEDDEGNRITVNEIEYLNDEENDKLVDANNHEVMEKSEEQASQQEEEHPKKKKKNKKKKEEQKKVDHEEMIENKEKEIDEISSTGLGSWSPEALDGVKLHHLLLQNLQRQGFHNPTPIQRATLPLAIGQGKDVMGAAETGSGKTLAYGLPILDYFLKKRDSKSSGAEKEALGALVLCPTRELAIQVTSHLQDMLACDKAAGRDRINLMSIVGGLSEIKQERLLKRKPEIVVATVGRFCELMQSNEAHLRDLGRLRFLVLDEADRMVEEGHYPELTRLLRTIVEQGRGYQQEYDESRRGKKQVEKYLKNNKAVEEQEEDDDTNEEKEEEADHEALLSPVEVPVKTLQDVLREARRRGIKGLHGLEAADLRTLEESSEKEENEVDQGDITITEVQDEARDIPPPVVRQTLIFSATLSLPDELREHQQQQKKKKKMKKKSSKKDSVMTKLMRDVGLRGKAAVVNLSTGVTGDDGQTSTAAATTTSYREERPKPTLSLPSGLELCYIKSVGGEKDVYLYYFLRRYPGRSIIFTNSIDQTRRIAQLLTIMRLPSRALHAKMQQRQRLKSLEYFRSEPQAILVATDVAARGLDIPMVENVVHYDLPRSMEVFVHRSGRTARANREGLSFSLVAPRDEKMHSDICTLLLQRDQQGNSSMTVFPVDLQELSKVRERVTLAGRIVGYEQEVGRQQATQSWFLKSARDADLPLDDELLEEAATGFQGEKERQRARQHSQDLSKLDALLSQPLHVEKKKFINVSQKLQQQRLLESQHSGVHKGRQIIQAKKKQKHG